MSRYTLHKYIPRLMAVLLVLILLVGAIPTVYADGESGTCGDSLSWSLSAGTLTISGSGAMTDFPESTMAPWYALREEITRVVLPEGLTSVGTLAFYGCENLTAVTIPNSVTSIGAYAFAGCVGLEMLNLGSGVKSVGQCAFSDCYALASLRLPDSLQTIGMKAFYRCEAITTVTVPASVTSIGVSAFAYCKSLVSAAVNASISTVPEYMFYGCERLTSVDLPDSVSSVSEFAFRGCDSLNSVYYEGGTISREELQGSIDNDVPGFGSTGFVGGGTPSKEVVSGTTYENSDGTITQENITVSESENVSVSTKVETTVREDFSEVSTNAEITITVNGEQGWSEAKDAAEDALKDYSDNVAASASTLERVDINVYVQGTDTIDQSFVESLAGRDVQMTVITENGSVWRMNGTEMDISEPSGEYNLAYTLTAGTEELCAELETASCFILQFHAPAEVNAEVLIRIGQTWALQNATLFQRGEENELTRFQTVVVDREGYAHFYLASVTDETDYYIAMNLPAQQETAIVPEELQQEFGYPENYTPIQYQITGRTSSWGMNINQVTWILVGVLAASVIIVGIVMYMLNKRRLKNGYIPDMDDE